MEYNIITDTEGKMGYYDYPIGTETFFVMYSHQGIEIINTNNTSERYQYAFEGNIDTIKEVFLPIEPGDAPSRAIMVALHKLGLQYISFQYDGAEVKAVYSEITPVNLECRDIVQIGDYIIACNQETYKTPEFTDIPSSALSVINMSDWCADKNPCNINFRGVYDYTAFYTRGDSVDYPIKSIDSDGIETITYERKITCSDGIGDDLIWIKPKLQGYLSSVTDELFDTHVLITYNDGSTDKIITDAGQLGILIYDFDSSTGVLTLDDYFREETEELTENYIYFLVKDGDYIYYNRNNFLMKLNITDFTDYNRFDFGEEVNNININNNSGKVITTNKIFDVNFNLFNDADMNAGTKIKINGTEISDEDGIKIDGISGTEYSYLYIKDNKSYLKIIDGTSETNIYICDGKAKDFSIYNSLYYIIDNANSLKIYDYNNKSFIAEESTYYNNICNNIMFQGSKQSSIDSIDNIFNVSSSWALNDEFKTMVVTNEQNKSKLASQNPDKIIMEASEYNFKISYIKNNLLVLHNNDTSTLVLRDLKTLEEKEFRGVKLFTIKDEVLNIFTPKVLYTALINTVEPNVKCIVLKEKEIPELPINNPKTNCTKINILKTPKDYEDELSQNNCHETITEVYKLSDDKFIFRYNVKSINIGIFDSENKDLQYFLENDNKVQDVVVDNDLVFFISNEDIKIFDLNLVPVQVINLSTAINFPKGFLSNNILILTAQETIFYIDITDLNNVNILETTYEDYVKDSEINILGNRLFICTIHGVNEFVFDMNNIDYTNIVNTSTIQSTGLNSSLVPSTMDNIANYLKIEGNELYFVSLPTNDILYAPTDGKLNISLDKYFFGYNNILVDNHYRLYDSDDYHTEVIKIDLVQVNKTEYTTNYRVLDICYNDTTYFLRTDDNIISKNNIGAPDNIILSKQKLFDSNNSYLVAYLNGTLTIYNLVSNTLVTHSIQNIKYLRVDKNSNTAFYQSDGDGYYIDLVTLVSTPVQNKSVQSSFFKSSFVTIEGAKKDVQEGDRVLSIFGRDIDYIQSINNTTSYNIEEGLQNLNVYVDNKKVHDFTYVQDVLNINYPFTGYEVISYTFIEDPFYGSDNIKYQYKYKSETNTSVPKGTDKYGNDVFDYNDLDVAMRPTTIKSVGSLVTV